MGNVAKKMLVSVLPILFILITSCNSSTNKKEPSLKDIEIARLKDSTVTNIFLDLELGSNKDTILAYLKKAEQEGKIKNLKKYEIGFYGYKYKGTNTHVFNDTYHFETILNVPIDSIYKPMDFACIIDFHNSLLYSCLLYPNGFILRHELEAVCKMYLDHYGIGFTYDSIPPFYDYRRYSIAYNSITHYTSISSNNVKWGFKNIDVILAYIENHYTDYEFDLKSLNRASERFKQAFPHLKYDEESEARYIIDKALLLNKKESTNLVNFIIYRDVRIHNDRLKEQVIENEEKDRLDKIEKRKKEISDSLLNEENKKKYNEQTI